MINCVNKTLSSVGKQLAFIKRTGIGPYLNTNLLAKYKNEL